MQISSVVFIKKFNQNVGIFIFSYAISSILIATKYSK